MVSSLGQRLRALRVERGLSQAELAGDLVSPSYVSLIEADRRSPEREVLAGLAHRLSCSAVYLETGVVPEEISEQRLQLKFAEIALANGELDEAHDRFRALSLQASSEINHGAIWGLAQTEEALGNLHEAMTHLEALLEPARAGEPGAPGLLSLLIARCRIYRLAGDFARSIEVGEDAVREVRELGLEGTEDEVRLASSLVGCYFARGDMFSAQHLVSRVIERAEKLGSRQAQGAAYWNASAVAAARGQLTDALELASKTLAMLAEAAPDASLAGMRITHAWLLLRCDPPRLDEADVLLARAHEVLSAMSFSPHLANCETEMARSALLRGDFDEAIRIAGKAIERCEEAGAAEGAHAKVVTGLALVMSGQPDEGAALAGTAAERLATMGSQLEAAQAWRELAEALIQRGRAADAVDALRRASDYAGVRAATIRSGLTAPVHE
ncbi:MAG TPA: helix-turn-helix domain-containing protein [Streptosporangiaceae bacterium]|nr:helix-turn-helix domain-containing protein [Streptosporangiaceae bacterium]